MITVKRQFVQRTLAAITLVLVLGALSMIWPAIIERRGRDRGRDHRLSTLYITDRHHGIGGSFCDPAARNSTARWMVRPRHAALIRYACRMRPSLPPSAASALRAVVERSGGLVIGAMERPAA